MTGLNPVMTGYGTLGDTPDHYSQPTGFHDNMSIVPERYDHEVFKKMSFENSNSKFVTATGAA
jgi:hypothetical protein